MIPVLAALLLAGPVQINDIEGKPVRLGAPGPVQVVLFLGNECPVSNGYSGGIRRIVADFKPKGVRFVCVYPEPGVTVEDVRRHLREYEISVEAALDPKLTLATWAGATRMPEASVSDRNGVQRYRGRIDNLYASLGNRRAKVTKHDLRDAIAAVLAGKPIAVPKTQAIGCVIPR